MKNILILIFSIIGSIASAKGGYYVSMFSETYEKNERVSHVRKINCEYKETTFEELLKTTQSDVKKLGLNCIDQRFMGEDLIWCRPDADLPNRTEIFVEAERGEFKCQSRAQKRLQAY